MGTITTGRTLDGNGRPVPGTGIEIEADGPIAEKLRERTSPLVSNPVTGEWVTSLVEAEETGGEYAVGLGIFSPGNDGPPRHFHVDYEEAFEVLHGEFVIEQDGEEHRLSTGEEHVVPADAVHTFRNVGDAVGATITTARPASQTYDVITTLFGLAHEGRLNDAGRPGFLQGMALTAGLSDDTVFTSPPPTITQPLATLLAPLANARGYRASYPEYLDESFWARHVEQPDF
ncbi:cupin domain-containing protein (plasmid) [Haladaptatus sp. SPP-AMP-3]|uniref:cupin domain-containing protein n=1 Tax=Haladaptatus sp. SPP-AMP-3 TaxID=3121295 RepID=UPI003C2D5F3F